MRAVRLVIAVLIVSPILMLALSESRLSRQPFAQVTAAPGPVPLTAPVAPGQPQAFSTIGALPALAPAPGILSAAAASVAPTPRAFRCTCSAPGIWTEWAGVVSSSSYVLASQSASTQCANYILNENAPSAYIPPEGSTREPAKADALQRRGVHAARDGVDLGGTVVSPATLDGSAGADPVYAMRLQLKSSQGLINDLSQTQ